jgi:hypothetical protein
MSQCYHIKWIYFLLNHKKMLFAEMFKEMNLLWNTLILIFSKIIKCANVKRFFETRKQWVNNKGSTSRPYNHLNCLQKTSLQRAFSCDSIGSIFILYGNIETLIFLDVKDHFKQYFSYIVAVSLLMEETVVLRVNFNDILILKIALPMQSVPITTRRCEFESSSWLGVLII